MLWTNADGTSGEKQLALSSDVAGKRWIVTNGEYFSVSDGWHNVVITKSKKTVNSVVSEGMVSITIKPDGGNITVDFN